MSVRPGTSVLVHKADGSTKTEMIERVGEEFDGMVYGYIAKAAKPATKTATKSTSARTSSTRCRECRGELQTWSDGFHDGLCHDCF